jgi:hypothetical protein
MIGVPKLVAAHSAMEARRHGMTILEPKAGERVKDVHFTEDTISLDLADSRTIVVPLA